MTEAIKRNGTLKIVGKTPAPLGGSFFVVRRVGAWCDVSANDDNDYIPDLRLHRYLAGKDEAAFFGFHVLDSNHVLVPNTLALRMAISHFNDSIAQVGPLQIPVNPVRVNGTFASSAKYVNTLLVDSRTPISTKQSQALHDLAGHGLQWFYLPSRWYNELESGWKAWNYAKRATREFRSEMKLLHPIVLRLFGQQLDESANVIYWLLPSGRRNALEAQNRNWQPHVPRRYGGGIPDENIFIRDLGDGPKKIVATAAAIASSKGFLDPRIQLEISSEFARVCAKLAMPAGLSIRADLKRLLRTHRGTYTNLNQLSNNQESFFFDDFVQRRKHLRRFIDSGHMGQTLRKKSLLKLSSLIQQA